MIAVPIAVLALVASVQAHTAGWAKGMYCQGGNVTGVDDSNTNTAVNPLYGLSFEDFWFQHDRGCDKVPPPVGEFLELAAGGQVTLELAHNRAFTTLSYNGQHASDWPDGQAHPEDWNGNNIPGEGCIQNDGAMHTSNQSTSAGTALAISYHSDIADVTLENLVVFSVVEHTPWHRVTTYDIPAGLPACPPGGCTCAWLWVPKGCGTPNMYMHGYKCNVTGATSTIPIGVAKPPTWCGNDASKCQQGPKQMIVWNQAAEANNVFPPNGHSPGYNAVDGFQPGAQNDIFVSQSVVASSTTAHATSTKAVSSTSTQSTSAHIATSAVAPVRPVTVLSSYATTLATVTKAVSSPIACTPVSTAVSVKPTTVSVEPTPVSIKPTTVPAQPGTTSKAAAAAATTSACLSTRRPRHRRALGRFAEAIADKLESYDI